VSLFWVWADDVSAF
jgi:hypothetical protein